MAPPVRIALVGMSDPTLQADLLALPSRPEVRAFPSVYGDTESIQQWQPEVLFVVVHDDATETTGALRVLRGLMPGMAMVLVGSEAHEVVLEPLARRLGARVLLQPARVGDLASVLEQALAGGDQPRAEVFLDLVRGIADEINNPLMYVSGYLQLLRAGLDGDRDRDKATQLHAALAGVARIQQTLQRVQLLTRAERGARLHSRLDLVAALQDAMARRAQGNAVPLHAGPQPCLPFRGDPELIASALDAFVRVATEFAELGDEVGIHVDAVGAAARARLRVHGRGLRSWRLPRTFEPYYLNRVFRGTSQGLGLFLVQEVLHSHRGQAIARRLGDDVLAIDLLLPLADA